MIRFFVIIGKLALINLFLTLMVSLSPASAQDLKEFRNKWVGANQKLYEINNEITLTNAKVMELKKRVAELSLNSEKLKDEIVRIEKLEKSVLISLTEAKKQFDIALLKEQNQLEELDKNEEQLAVMLALLQKMQYSPPPALLVNTADVVSSFRGSLLLGAITPDIKKQTEKIKEILIELEQTKKKLEENYLKVKRLQLEHEEKRVYLSLLYDEKLKQKNSYEQDIEQGQKLVNSWTEESKNLQSLLEDLKKQQNEQLAQPATNKSAAAKKLTFKGKKLAFPSGAILHKRYDSEASGLIYAKGELISLPKDDIVNSFADAIVLYAKEFRSYGKLIIFDLGDNYQLVLSGFTEIYVKENQLVKKGDKIGKLYNSLTDKQSFLYVELRKNGTAVNVRSYRNSLPAVRK